MKSSCLVSASALYHDLQTREKEFRSCGVVMRRSTLSSTSSGKQGEDGREVGLSWGSSSSSSSSDIFAFSCSLRLVISYSLIGQYNNGFYRAKVHCSTDRKYLPQQPWVVGG